MGVMETSFQEGPGFDQVGHVLTVGTPSPAWSPRTVQEPGGRAGEGGKDERCGVSSHHQERNPPESDCWLVRAHVLLHPFPYLQSE